MRPTDGENKSQMPVLRLQERRADCFGYPAPETMDASDRGEISLGGCIVTENDPDWRWKECEHEW